MQDFFKNVIRYPTYLVALILGIFISFFERFRPLLKNQVAVASLIGIGVAVFAFFYFTVRGMLGLNSF